MQPATVKEASHSQDDSSQKRERETRLAFLFDLDGTLVDSVYRHVQAWQEALLKVGFAVPAWRIHRRIGLSGSKLIRALLCEMGREMKDEEIKQAEKLHGEAYGRLIGDVKPLPGARELLDELTRLRLPWAIVTSSKPEKAQPVLKALGITSEDTVVTRGEVQRAKPEPDPFYVGAERLSMKIRDCVVIGDSLEGRAELHLEGQVVLLEAGDSWVVPEGASHSYQILEPFTAVEATCPPAVVHGRDRT